MMTLARKTNIPDLNRKKAPGTCVPRAFLI